MRRSSPTQLWCFPSQTPPEASYIRQASSRRLHICPYAKSLLLVSHAAAACPLHLLTIRTCLFGESIFHASQKVHKPWVSRRPYWWEHHIGAYTFTCESRQYQQIRDQHILIQSLIWEETCFRTWDLFDYSPSLLIWTGLSMSTYLGGLSLLVGLAGLLLPFLLITAPPGVVEDQQSRACHI